MKNKLAILLLTLLSRLALGQGGTKDVVICNGTTVKLKAQSTGANGYEWRKDNSIIPGFSGAELVVAEEGKYSALAFNNEGCVSDLSVTIIVEFRKPVAANDYVKGLRNIRTQINALENDEASCAELDPATLSIKTPPGKGSVSVVNGQFVYEPSADLANQDEFKYTVKDRSGQESNLATVSLDFAAALPVTLSDFKALKQESTTLLTWTTTSESNSEKFVVERSTDGKIWNAIGSVAASGTSSGDQQYDHTDALPESGTNYYRLRMIDLDGTYAVSRIRSVHFPEFSWANLFPNPVSHTLHISIRNKNVRKLRLIDPTGKVLFRSAVKEKEMELNMQPYSVLCTS
jgi:hypothetical protein